MKQPRTWYFIALADEPDDIYAAGFDGNYFKTYAEAQAAADVFERETGMEGPWIVNSTTWDGHPALEKNQS